jgi:YgiT-type zinc finger domain-containing protein
MSKGAEPRVCPLCGGEQTAGRTTFTADLGFTIVVVRQVPAAVCAHCGTEWISPQIAARLEKMVAAARRKKAEVEILSGAHLA